MFPAVERLKIRHFCIEKGVRLEIFLRGDIALDAVKDLGRNPKVKDYYLFFDGTNGFYRCYFDGNAALSAVIASRRVTALYSYSQQEKIHRSFEELFPGFLKKWNELVECEESGNLSR